MPHVERIPYDQYRTGLTFDDVREILSQEQEQEAAAGRYMFVTRATVLGRWHELKRTEYAAYLRDLQARKASGRPWTWNQHRDELADDPAFDEAAELAFSGELPELPF